MQLVMNNVNTT